MADTRVLPLRYSIEAAVEAVLPVVAALLVEERQFGVEREVGREPAWRLRRLIDNRAIGRLVLLEGGDERSELVAAPAATNGHRSRASDLTPALETLIAGLQEHGFAIAPAGTPESNGETSPVVLLVAPATAFFDTVATRLAAIAAEHGFALHRPPETVEVHPFSLEQDVAAATVVIADLATARGRAAADAAASTSRLMVPIAPQDAVLPPQWQQGAIQYDGNPIELVQGLADRIAAGAPTDRVPHVEADDDQTQPHPVLPGDEEQEGGPASPEVGRVAVFSDERVEQPSLRALLGAQPGAARRLIYRATALDPHATPERRFHAARVLAAYGDREGAAMALGAVARAATPLRDEALTRLGKLGAAARVALWSLDATEENPERSIAIARQLHAVGDTPTARLRLERLARHPDREVRLAALDALADLGVLALREFTHLLDEAEDPRVRLEAARWLRLHQLELGKVVETLGDLANQPDNPQLAMDALHELGAIRTVEALDTLTGLAHRAHLGDMRLAAAQVLGRRGDADAARKALLAIAEGQDEDAAPSAAEALFAFGQDVPSDTERLMLGAALFSVRRRAATQLAREDQPEEVQQQAARVLLTLDRPDQALPTLQRLALRGRAGASRRWAAEQLANLGVSAAPAMLEVLEATEDRAIGLRLAEALLRVVPEPPVRRRVAAWMGAHESAAQAAEVLAALALDPRIAESEAHAALTALIRMGPAESGAVKAAGQLAREAPLPSVRRRALEYLLRHHIEELPLGILIDLAVREQSPVDLAPLLNHLPAVAVPIAQRIVEESLQRETSSVRRWRLLNLLMILPPHVMITALRQLAARAPGASLREVAAERLLAAGQTEAGLAALASLAQSAAHPEVRRRALFRLQQARAIELLRAVAAQSPYADARELGVQLLQELGVRGVGQGWRERWTRWVERLPLGWLDRLLRGR